MSLLLQDLRYALRKLRKSPGFSAAVVATLALAIGVNTAMFSLINTILFSPLPFTDAGRLTYVFRIGAESGSWEPFSYPDFLEYRDRCDAFEELSACSMMPVSVETESGSESRFGQVVTGNYFAALGARAAHGRLLTPADDLATGEHPVVVLSHRLWRRAFGGDASAVGRTIRLGGKPFTIVGITPRGFSGALPVPSPDLWAPMAMLAQIRPEMSGQLEERTSGFLHVIGRRRPEVSLEQAQVRLSAAAARLVEVDPDRYADENVVALPARGAFPLTPNMRRVALAISALVMAMVGLVLIVGCANVANLLLARAIDRTREIGIRVAVGASRPRIVRQLLTESVVLALAGGAAGLLLAVWSLDLLVASLPDLPYNVVLDLSFGVDWRVLGFTAAVSLFTGVLFGLLPARGATRVDVAAAVRDDRIAGRHGFRRSRLRSTLVVAQVAASLVLLIVAGLFVRSLMKARAIDPGFNHKEVLAVAFDMGSRDISATEAAGLCERLLARVRSLPGVSSACIMEVVPLSLAVNSTGFWIEGRRYDDPEEAMVDVTFSAVSSDCFRTLDIPLLRGRDFSAGDTADAPLVAVVNQAFVDRFWPGENPIGRRISTEGPEGPFMEVIGVTTTIKHIFVGEDPRPFVYRAGSQRPFTSMATLLVRTPGDPLALAAPVREVFREVNPDAALSSTSRLTELIGFILLPARFAAAGFGVFGFLALALAAIGLYGVMSYTVSRRTHEIGIRVALGAQRGDIIRLVMKQGIRLTALGLVIGLAVCLAVTRLLGNLLYGIGATDAATFAGVSAMLAAIALVACWLPAYRATRVSPADTLRFE